jgi:hypothetical protein
LGRGISLSGKKNVFKELEEDKDLVLSKDMLSDDDDNEKNWWEIINDPDSHEGQIRSQKSQRRARGEIRKNKMRMEK